jgi:hypothetical protein
MAHAAYVNLNTVQTFPLVMNRLTCKLVLNYLKLPFFNFKIIFYFTGAITCFDRQGNCQGLRKLLLESA